MDLCLYRVVSFASLMGAGLINTWIQQSRTPIYLDVDWLNVPQRWLRTAATWNCVHRIKYAPKSTGVSYRVTVNLHRLMSYSSTHHGHLLIFIRWDTMMVAACSALMLGWNGKIRRIKDNPLHQESSSPVSIQSACVACVAKTKTARNNASDCVWMKTGLNSTVTVFINNLEARELDSECTAK